MAGADYSSIEGLLRIVAAGQKVEDTFAIEVLAFHAALEIELDVVLSGLMPRPDAVLKAKGKRLSFPQKAQLLVALWKGDADKADKINAVLREFENLRNEVAHKGDIPLKSWKAKLDAAFRVIEPEAGDDPSMFDIARGTATYFADNTEIDDFLKALTGLDEMVNDTFPRIFAAKDA